MTDAVLMVVVVGVIALTLAVDLAALIGWLRKREARHNEAGRKSTRTGKHDVGINRQRWSRVEGPRGYGLARRLAAVGRRARWRIRGLVMLPPHPPDMVGLMRGPN